MSRSCDCVMPADIAFAEPLYSKLCDIPAEETTQAAAQIQQLAERVRERYIASRQIYVYE